MAFSLVISHLLSSLAVVLRSICWSLCVPTLSPYQFFFLFVLLVTGFVSHLIKTMLMTLLLFQWTCQGTLLMLSSTTRITEHLRYDLLSSLCSQAKVKFHSFLARPIEECDIADLWPTFRRIISILGSQAGTLVISDALHVYDHCMWAKFQSFSI